MFNTSSETRTFGKIQPTKFTSGKALGYAWGNPMSREALQGTRPSSKRLMPLRASKLKVKTSEDEKETEITIRPVNVHRRISEGQLVTDKEMDQWALALQKAYRN